MNAAPWTENVKVAQVRIARPTGQLAAIVKFYRDALGLQVIGKFEDHDGYSGVMLGLPGREYHLEFTQHGEGSDCPAPSRDNLLVLYLPDAKDLEALRLRLAAHGHAPVPPENPYWAEKGLTYEDPDGWRVVLMGTSGI